MAGTTPARIFVGDAARQSIILSVLDGDGVIFGDATMEQGGAQRFHVDGGDFILLTRGVVGPLIGYEWFAVVDGALGVVVATEIVNPSGRRT